MSKMREAFEKWYATRRYAAVFANTIARDGFEAGFQAAIAAVKEGGAVAWKADNGQWACCKKDADVYEKRMAVKMYPLYKLPEDES